MFDLTERQLLEIDLAKCSKKPVHKQIWQIAHEHNKKPLIRTVRQSTRKHYTFHGC